MCVCVCVLKKKSMYIQMLCTSKRGHFIQCCPLIGPLPLTSRHEGSVKVSVCLRPKDLLHH